MLLKVLVVDENTEDQEYLKSYFPDSAFKVDWMTNANSALDWLNEGKESYTLIVASSTTLGDEPEAFSLSLRTHDRYVHTPLILITPENTLGYATYYAVGFTQVYSKLEMGLFKEYIDQRLQQKEFIERHSHHVLLIEDDRSQQLVFHAILEKNQCTISSYTSAEEALEQTELAPDVILVDFFLAGKMTGMEFITQVKRPFHPWFKTPIIAMTGIDDQARKYECLRAGANDYMVKPLEPIDLSVRVDNALKYKHLLDTVEQQIQRMQHLAMHDQLTGLYNRHFMVSQASKRIKEASRHDIPLSIIMLDIDHFKKVNDTHGHDTGDKVLMDAANTLKAQSRDEDIVIRLGGEEFLIMLGYCNLENALLKAEMLRQSISTNNLGGIEITASFGVAQLSRSLNTFDRLYKSADDAVYKAKKNGRDRVERGSDHVV